MAFHQEPIFIWLSQFAFQPELVYLAVFGMMVASGFGFPLPEEVTILSVGILAYMGSQPEQFPPPYPGAPTVHPYEAAAFTLFAVLFADSLVFMLGRVFGRKIITETRFRYLFTEKVMNRINSFVKRFGNFAVFIFRFTPGIRFPAHVVLGMSHLSFWTFFLVDALAALISVPTQILLVSFYGEEILSTMHRFKLWVLGIGAVLLVVYLLRLWWLRSKRNSILV